MATIRLAVVPGTTPQTAVLPLSRLPSECQHSLSFSFHSHHSPPLSVFPYVYSPHNRARGTDYNSPLKAWATSVKGADTISRAFRMREGYRFTGEHDGRPRDSLCDTGIYRRSERVYYFVSDRVSSLRVFVRGASSSSLWMLDAGLSNTCPTRPKTPDGGAGSPDPGTEPR